MKITEWKGYTQSVSLILERLKSHVRFQLRINLLFSFKFPVSTIPEWFSLWRASSWQTPTHFSCASKKSLLDVRRFVKLEFNLNDDLPYRIKIHFLKIKFFFVLVTSKSKSDNFGWRSKTRLEIGWTRFQIGNKTAKQINFILGCSKFQIRSSSSLVIEILVNKNVAK